MKFKDGTKFIWEHTPSADLLLNPHRIKVELIRIPDEAVWKKDTKSPRCLKIIEVPEDSNLKVPSYLMLEDFTLSELEQVND